MTLTNSQIDKIGRKLRKGEINEECLLKLDEFRGLHRDAYRHVEDVLVNKLHLTITGRPFKSTVAITEKLRRETIRLNQIQDIAGCRVLVPALAHQDSLVESLQVLFASVEVDDKRKVNHGGYRAVHLIVTKNDRPVEVQVRTHLQHAWADLSEKVADEFGHSIKYGTGDEEAIRFLNKLSLATEELEYIRHKQHSLRQARAASGKNKDLVRNLKAANEQERDCLKRVRAIFDGKY